MPEQLALRFGGATYEADRDGARLGQQMQRVLDFMLSRRDEWHTLADLSRACHAPEASVSARLRDMRKLGFEVKREYVSRGLWRYMVSSTPV